MINLAIECSGLHGSVAITRDREVLLHLPLPENLSSAQTLSSTIAAALQRITKRPDLLSVTSGPGSFTGLRVGLATAKMLGMAWKIPIVPVDTLEVIAVQMGEQLPYWQSTTLIPVMNAFRGQVFTASWQSVSNDSVLRLSPTQVIDAQLWQRQPLLSQQPLFSESTPSQPVETGFPVEILGNRVVIAGPGLDRYPPLVTNEGSCSVIETVSNLTPQADRVAKLGLRLFGAGSFTTPIELTANYVRPSAAEEKLPK